MDKVLKWKASFIRKYGKLLRDNANCWRKVEMLYMIVKRVKDESVRVLL